MTAPREPIPALDEARALLGAMLHEEQDIARGILDDAADHRELAGWLAGLAFAALSELASKHDCVDREGYFQMFFLDVAQGTK